MSSIDLTKENQEINHWNRFLQTGSINDYLMYKNKGTAVSKVEAINSTTAIHSNEADVYGDKNQRTYS